MERLVELLLNSGLRPPLFDPDVAALDRTLPRSELLALFMLQRRGEATMSDLAADLGAPLSTVTGIGERLARRGLVERQRHPGDRRVILVRLTPAGQELAARVQGQVDGLVRRVQGVLSEAELQQLVALLQKVARAFQPAPSTATGAPDTGVRRIPIEE